MERDDAAIRMIVTEVIESTQTLVDGADDLGVNYREWATTLEGLRRSLAQLDTLVYAASNAARENARENDAEDDR